MPFIRVKDLTTKHEYDAPVATVERWPDRYEVLNPEPVPRQRPPKLHVKRHRAPVEDARLSAPVEDAEEPTPNDPRLSQAQ